MSSPAESSIRSHARSENFPVALRVLTRDQRRHLLSIYDFARLTDQIGDTGDAGHKAGADRIAQLDALESELESAVDDRPISAQHTIVRALVPTIRACQLPLDPFRRLIAANRVDQHKKCYATWTELLDYCALSANPIGELVLRVFGFDVEPRRAWSDAVCSGLQIVEHLQDVREDYAAGRIYLPTEDLEKFGCRPPLLGARFASPTVRNLLRFEAERAHTLLEDGVPLAASLTGRARMAIAGFVAGGRAALDAIERADFDTLVVSPRPRRHDLLRHLVSVQRAARTHA